MIFLPMTIGFLQMDLLMRNTHSLKDKRSIISRIKNQIRAKYNVAVAEIDRNDQYRQCLLGITTISNDHQIVNQTLNAVEKLVENCIEIQIVARKMEML
ncbi:MAG: DUF503 domain-containing protein [Candidatus Neomarinimicrobiota bacterium]